ncbi:(2Fe-2S)-binding protein [Solidesulfovibrio magneticus]|uniref:BFD-like [2Fe-2S]-binding domain-containing protein n=1 Tax=Solidesulfovibrio magneticus (strain ATCC 700980 / DSM 13731 / RS-1) TaxID=573370 RepID=C4XTS0_SOLM1|nr:(2Fe-2S)-binding protein [Solidesulfovibrio magneticus]BAH73585.1 hypothetical protein DMR_00940 [Solidesulfovibrio magneticus RS-1]
MLQPLTILGKQDHFDPKDILTAPIDAIVCYCGNVTKGQVLDAISDGAKTLAEIKESTGACTSASCKELSPRRR